MHNKLSKGILIGSILIGLIAGGVWYKNVYLLGDQSQKLPESNDGSTITIVEDGFVPDTLTVKAGTTVKFVNRDTYWHWPASDPHPSHTFYSELDPRQPVKPGDTWTVTLTKPGKWGIHDHLAPYIVGTIIVTP
jgi:plastocyanin